MSKSIIKYCGVANILGGLKANYSNTAPKVMYYSARGPDPEDNSLADADIMKPNLIAPGNFIWGAWSSVGTDSAEFEGTFMSTHEYYYNIIISISRTSAELEPSMQSYHCLSTILVISLWQLKLNCYSVGNSYQISLFHDRKSARSFP